jgi:hydroxymethylpyrimidine pyrophosphatase-like HAD family hydrolase
MLSAHAALEDAVLSGNRTSPVRALALDYDGTLASDGRVPSPVLEGLRRLRAAGRRLILVTGRERLSLSVAFPQQEIFDRIVAENGALLYEPPYGRETLLAAPPPQHFVTELLHKGVRPLSVGSVIVSTTRDHEARVQQTIRELGFDLHLSFNRESLMVLPAGVNKGTGLEAALDSLAISFRDVVAVGDAENDLPFLNRSGCAVAVANALPAVKEIADLVTLQPEGAGIAELADQLLTDHARAAGTNAGQ